MDTDLQWAPVYFILQNVLLYTVSKIGSDKNRTCWPTLVYSYDKSIGRLTYGCTDAGDGFGCC